jgi:hypothetical protein
MLKSFHVLPSPSDAELLAYVFFTCARKKRVGWRLPATYFIATQEWVPRSAIKERVYLVNYMIHKHFKENALRYVHRYQWAPFDKVTEVIIIKSLSSDIVEQIYALVAKNQWTLDAVHEEQNSKFNYLNDTHLQNLKTHSRHSKIRAGFILVNFCLLSALGMQLLSFTKTWQQIQVVEQMRATTPNNPKTSNASFEYEALTDVLATSLQQKQTAFQNWTDVKSIFQDYPGIQIDSYILKNEKQLFPQKPLDQKVMTIKGHWYLNAVNTKSSNQPTNLFEHMIKQLRSLPTVEQVHCIQYDFISESEIQFTIKIDFKINSESLRL